MLRKSPHSSGRPAEKWLKCMVEIRNHSPATSPNGSERKKRAAAVMENTNVDGKHASRFECDLLVGAVHNARRVRLLNGRSFAKWQQLC